MPYIFALIYLQIFDVVLWLQMVFTACLFHIRNLKVFIFKLGIYKCTIGAKLGIHEYINCANLGIHKYIAQCIHKYIARSHATLGIHKYARLPEFLYSLCWTRGVFNLTAADLNIVNIIKLL